MNGAGDEVEEWAKAKVWPSLESITLKCPRPLADSGGLHWWYNDAEALEAMDLDEPGSNHIPIVCKSCGLKLKLSEDAPEFPAI